LTPTRRQHSAIREIVAVLAVWIKGQFLIWLSVTGLYLIGFAIARTPLWPVLAILCGIAGAIPHLGALFSLLFVLFVSFFLSGGETSVMVEALAVWAAVNMIDSFVISPRLVGRKLGLNPWIVFLGGIAGALLAGPVGILIATPVLAIAAVIWRRTRRTHSSKQAVKY
jgi:predicted PurR-regulated permease PerM